MTAPVELHTMARAGPPIRAPVVHVMQVRAALRTHARGATHMMALVDHGMMGLEGRDTMALEVRRILAPVVLVMQAQVDPVIRGPAEARHAPASASRCV